MELKKLPRAVSRLRCLYALALSLLIFSAYTLVIVFFDALTLALTLSLATLTVVSVVLIWLFALLSYELYRYGYNKTCIVVERGVIFRQKITIPVIQIQDLHRVQGPIMLIMKLGGIEVSTAGSNFVLAYLSVSEADKMIDDLMGELEKTEVA